MDPLIEDTANRIFADHQEAGPLWRALEANGLTRAWAPEALGGFGAGMADGYGLMRASGRAFAEAPLADTLVAVWALAAAGREAPAGPLAIAADGEVPEDAPEWLVPDVLRQIAALARAAQMVGAMEAALDLSLEHAATREQFGRPLAKFQAIQHLLADIACETAAASAAVEAAAETVSLTGPPDLRAVAAAKVRAGEAAGIVAARAHQVHGAIGYTDEYALARFSRRLWRWRDDFGGETEWSGRLGAAVAGDDRPLFEQISGGSHG